ncbi:hypothetical protein HMPREF0063_11037 [Aeromicrobium marinum DSM 15272]|uniref:DUF559 domain-containing protein n=2 Tax=Aeromicrobium marinum TaxID=219314 RepID=E2S951_9ACTN|nr:hypothetical protein HMPREF0063_11037 [Aeromicrobium marinum DSM 15272]
MRTSDALAAGWSAKALRGPAWQRQAHGVVRPAGSGGDPTIERIAAVRPLLTGACAIGGWASLRIQGNEWFTGSGHDRTVRRVLVHCPAGAQLRPTRGVEPCRAGLYPDEFLDLDGWPVSTMARAVYDEMRTARDFREAVVALDMVLSTTHGAPRTTLDRVDAVVASHRKTRGIVQARRALGWASCRSASPWETRTRLVARIDAGIPALRVNAPLFGPGGELLGVADLLEPESGLVIESDGAHHREAVPHAEDNAREERFEDHGLVVARVSALDHRDRWSLAGRLVTAWMRARRTRAASWTLDEPVWWGDWEPGRRWR